MDGGRMQLRGPYWGQADAVAVSSVPETTAAQAGPVASAPDPVHATASSMEASAARENHWREDKVGCLLTMTSEVTAIDPCPDIPKVFVDPLQWIQWVWSGQVDKVLAALHERQKELGEPEEGAAAGSPAQVVAEALTYLSNNRDYMHYDEYRCQGLPLMSSYAESTVKQVNRRVKGTEKFWLDEGAEPIMQLRADYLSDTEPMKDFWKRRQQGMTGQHRYWRVA
jgi:hypothetical protein